MATSLSTPTTKSVSPAPAWANCLGVVAIVFGVFLTAAHGNEWMKQAVITQSMPASGEMPAADCPEEELEEEGISLAECEYMVSHVEGIALSTPGWFPSVQMGLAFAGMILGFISIIIGGALINHTSWASSAAALTFGALVLVDLLQFAAVVSAGPILRDLYLWNLLLWFVIHLMMTTGAIAGRHSEAGIS